MTAHLYWRINITASNDTTYTGITEVELRATVGGADQCSGGTAWASGSTGSAEDAQYAFDNTTANRWAVQTPLNSWLMYQFASPVSVAEYTIQGRETFTGQSLNSWTLEYSDDGYNWGIADARNGVTFSSLEVKTYTLPTIGDLYRLYIDSNNGNGYTVVAEMEMRLTSGGTDQCTGGVAFASGVTGNVEIASNAFDNTVGNLWAQHATGSIYVGYAFTGSLTIAEYTITGRNGGFNDQNPKQWRLQKSTDKGITWTTVDERSSQTGWTNGEVRTFTVGNQSTASAQVSQVTVEVLRPDAALAPDRRPVVCIIT